MARQSKKTVKKITDRKQIEELTATKDTIAGRKKRFSPKSSEIDYHKIVNRFITDSIKNGREFEKIATTAKVVSKDNIFTSTSLSNISQKINDPSLEIRKLEYNFSEIGKFEDLESIVSRAFSRKKELSLKQGYSIVGKDKKVLDYVKSRMIEIEENSRTSSFEFLKQVISDLISRHNAFIWKKRGKSINPAASSFKFRGAKKEPIESVMVVPPELVRYIWDTKKLEVYGWLVDGYDTVIPYEDMIHLHINKKTGFVAGTPSVVSVIQDILSLRRTEQNLEIFIHLFVFPIIVYMLAEDKDGDDISHVDFEGEDIISKAQFVLNQMMNNGGAVLPPGDKIEIKGSSNNVDYKTFLAHLKSRVYTGLGVSSVDMGEGESSNRATAETISGVIVDSVKAIQKVVADKITSELFRDLMRESRNLKPEDIYNEKKAVSLFFNEIDLFYLIKYENHNSMMFAQNVITHTEARNRIGLDPVNNSEKKDLFSFMFNEINTGAAAATVSTANPTNQNMDRVEATKNKLLAVYTKELLDSNISLTREMKTLFDSKYPGYAKRHSLDSCSAELYNVKIDVAKTYFKRLASNFIKDPTKEK